MSQFPDLPPDDLEVQAFLDGAEMCPTCNGEGRDANRFPVELCVTCGGTGLAEDMAEESDESGWEFAYGE